MLGMALDKSLEVARGLVYRRGIDRRLLPERCAAWEEVTASDGRVYYHDKLSGKTSWDRPAGGVGGKTARLATARYTSARVEDLGQT